MSCGLIAGCARTGAFTAAADFLAGAVFAFSGALGAAAKAAMPHQTVAAPPAAQALQRMRARLKSHRSQEDTDTGRAALLFAFCCIFGGSSCTTGRSHPSQ